MYPLFLTVLLCFSVRLINTQDDEIPTDISFPEPDVEFNTDFSDSVSDITVSITPYPPEFLISESTPYEPEAITEPILDESEIQPGYMCNPEFVRICRENDVIYVNKTILMGDDLLLFFYYDRETTPYAIKNPIYKFEKGLLDPTHMALRLNWNMINATHRLQKLDEFIAAFAVKTRARFDFPLDGSVIFFLVVDDSISKRYLASFMTLYTKDYKFIAQPFYVYIDQYRADATRDTLSLRTLIGHFPPPYQMYARPVVAFPVKLPYEPRLLVYFDERNPSNPSEIKRMIHIFVFKENDKTWEYDKRSGECLLQSGEHRVQAASVLNDVEHIDNRTYRFQEIEFYENGEYGMRTIEMFGSERNDGEITAFSFDSSNIRERLQIRDLFDCERCVPTTTTTTTTPEPTLPEDTVTDTTEPETTITEEPTSAPKRKKSKVWLWILIVVIILLLIAGIAFAVYWFMFRAVGINYGRNWRDPETRSEEDIEMAERGASPGEEGEEPSPRTPAESEAGSDQPPPLPDTSPPHSTPSTPSEASGQGRAPIAYIDEFDSSPESSPTTSRASSPAK